MPEENADVRLRLHNKQFNAEAATSASALRGLRRETDLVGTSMSTASRRSFLMNQALFTARRVIYSTTLAMGVLGGAAATLGLKFNANMEQNRIAFKFLLGSERAANQELAALYELAAKTPFEFADLTMAARKFLGVGLSVRQTNRYLTAAADAVAAMGGGSDVISGVVRAFSQITTRGKVMGEELNQLAERGIPAYRILREELGLTGDQIARVGELGIPANVAIEALTRGMERRFRGASAELSKTVAGQLSTLRDYSRQLFGEILMAPFQMARGRLPAITNTVKLMAEAMRGEGFMAMVRVLDNSVGASGRLTMAFERLIQSGRDVATIFSTAIWPSMVLAFRISLVFAPLVLALAGLLGLLADHGEYLVVVVKLLTLWWIKNKVALMAVALWTAIKTGVDKLAAIWAGYLWVEEMLVTIWMGRRALAAKAAAFWTVGLWIVSDKLMKAYRVLVSWIAAVTIAQWRLNIAMILNPIGAIVFAATTLVLALIYLEIKFNAVSRAIQGVWDKMQAFKSWWDNNLGFIGDLGNLLKNVGGSLPVVGPLFGAASASGVGVGDFRRFFGGGGGPGGGLVPAMAGFQTVKPETGQGTNMQDMIPPMLIQLESILQMDSREIARANAEHRLDRKARR